jgi:hypothetical protein
MKSLIVVRLRPAACTHLSAIVMDQHCHLNFDRCCVPKGSELAEPGEPRRMQNSRSSPWREPTFCIYDFCRFIHLDKQDQGIFFAIDICTWEKKNKFHLLAGEAICGHSVSGPGRRRSGLHRAIGAVGSNLCGRSFFQ